MFERMTQVRWLVLGLGLIATLAAGCTTLQIATGLGLKEPEVSLDTLSVKSVSLTSMRIVARLNVSNPNRFGVEVSGYDYSLEVGTWPVVDGRVKESFSLPAGGGATIEVPLEIGFGNALGAGVDLLAGGGLSYTLKMTVEIASPFGPVTIPLTREGRISS